MGPERRIIFTGLTTALLPVGVVLCLTSGPIAISVGVVLVVFSGLLFWSLLFGKPISSLQADVSSPSMEGVPWVAPLTYQLDQLRQIIPQFLGSEFEEIALRGMIPKAKRTRMIPFHEPFENFQWRQGIAFMVQSEELEVLANGHWRATGKKPPSRWLRWKHGKDSKT